jgi:hypothetical protein
VEIEFTLCPPITTRKAGRGPNRADSKLGLRKVVVVRREKSKIMKILKGLKKVRRTGASCVRNLDTELVHPNVVTLLKRKSMFIFLQIFDVASFFSI